MLVPAAVGVIRVLGAGLGGDRTEIVVSNSCIFRGCCQRSEGGTGETFAVRENSDVVASIHYHRQVEKRMQARADTT